MKISLNFEDVKKLIHESYDGIKEVTLGTGKGNDFDILLVVDGDSFQRKKDFLKNTTQNIPNKTISTKDIIPKVDGKSKVDYESLLALKEVSSKQIAEESHIPLVKTLEEKNAEALKKGLMTTGRTSERIVSNIK